MFILFFMFNPKLVFRDSAWNKTFSFVFKLQKRLYKSSYVFDINKVFLIQKILFCSNSLRLLSIRESTQLSSIKKISGIDNKLYLTFSERFELNEFLKDNAINWNPTFFKSVYVLDKNNNTKFYVLPTVADRVWYCLVKMILLPVHEALFRPQNFGYRFIRSIYEIQNSFYLNLCYSSFGSQKRLLKIDLNDNFRSFNLHLFMNKLIIPRSIKLGIFRAFKKGLNLSYDEFYVENLPILALFLNILLDGIEGFSSSSIHYGSTVIYFLKPNEVEKDVIRKLKLLLVNLGLDYLKMKITMSSAYEGINFLKWNFKLSYFNEFICSPSILDYKKLLMRIKKIINNSNYGAEIKAVKISPLVKEWKLYQFIC